MPVNTNVSQRQRRSETEGEKFSPRSPGNSARWRRGLSHAGVYHCFGLVFCLLYVWLSGLSLGFEHAILPKDRPVLGFVSLYFLLFGVHMLVCKVTAGSISKGIWSIFLWGIAFRLVLLPSVPILEDDYYRYLWDGYTLKSGVSPYASSPLDVARRVADSSADSSGPFAPSSVGLLVDSVRKSPTLLEIVRRVNHPEVKTIYPPAAQVFFAAVWVGAPDDITLDSLRWRMRLLYLALECAIFFVFMGLVRKLGRAPGHVLLYWWNPIVIREVYNGLHIDLLPALLVLLAMALWVRGGRLGAAVSIAGATCTKLYGIVVAAALFERTRAYGWFLVALGTLCGSVALAMYLTVGLVPEGLAAYSSSWEMHSFFYRFATGSVNVLPFEVNARAVATAICLLGYLSCVIFVVRRKHVDRVESAGLLLALLPLFSPAAFPWYSIWFVPLLPFMRWQTWIALPPCLAVYYLRFWALYSEPSLTIGSVSLVGTEIFDLVISPAAYILFFVWVALSELKLRRSEP